MAMQSSVRLALKPLATVFRGALTAIKPLVLITSVWVGWSEAIPNKNSMTMMGIALLNPSYACCENKFIGAAKLTSLTDTTSPKHP
jgi:hypothetical protein